jgi:hypothetical protein
MIDEEMYSDPCDCAELNRKLIRELGNKIVIYGSITNPLINGKYYGLAPKGYYGDYKTINEGMQFFGKYCKDGFLRIEVGDTYKRKVSDGEKLAALSDICLALEKDYGVPDVFYTTKDDDEGRLSLQWNFKNMEIEHEKMEYDEYFDDANIEKLIFIDNTKPIVHDELSEQIGLPEELYGLVKANIEDFISHKASIEKEKAMKLVKKFD